MNLRSKFVVPINLILISVLAASLAWEWRRQEATGMALLRARLDEEARFVRAAYQSYGLTARFPALRDVEVVGLLEAAGLGPLAQLLERILNRAMGFRRGAGQRDDLTIVVHYAPICPEPLANHSGSSPDTRRMTHART